MYFDRFDIVEAYYVFFCDWHGGQSSDFYRRLSNMYSYFKPRMDLNGRESLSENGQEIYDNLCEKHNLT